MTNALPETGLLRLSQIIGRPETKRKPARAGLIPVSRSTWYEGVKSGRFPAPVRLGPMAVAWRAEDVRRIVEHGASMDDDEPSARGQRA